MFPYCYDARFEFLDEGDARREMIDWDCLRGVVLGLLSGLAFVVSLYAVFRIGRVFVKSGWYGLNWTMLALGAAQSLFLMVKYLFVRNQGLAFSAAYARGLQTLLTCANYAKLAAETGTDPEVFSRYFFPVLGMLAVYLTLVFLVTMAQKRDACFHPSFLWMSASQLVIVILFTVPGLAVMRKLAFASNFSHIYTDYSQGNLSEDVQKQKRSLWILLLVNAAGAITQLYLDVWLKNVFEDPETCVIFDSAAEELMRLALKVVSYDVPILATVYVYYYLPRVSSTDSNIENLENGEDLLEDAFDGFINTEDELDEHE